MIRNYAAHMETVVEILQPSTTKVNGIDQKTYPATGVKLFGNFKKVGGQESKNDDLLLSRDTGTIRMWYDDRVNNNCRIRLEDGSLWDVLHVDFVDMRKQQMIVKVEHVVGGA